MAITTTGPSFHESTGTAGRLMARVRGIHFTWPRIFLLLAALVLGASVMFEFWSLTLHARQYPDGLQVTVFTHQVTGDVSEVDGLNHYIGMMPLAEAAKLERSIERRPPWSSFCLLLSPHSFDQGGRDCSRLAWCSTRSSLRPISSSAVQGR